MLLIADVERDTGLGKDTLRAWERRYGFPAPMRDPRGQRAYAAADVDRLRQVAALLRAGYRPGKVVPMNDVERLALLQGVTASSPPSHQPDTPQDLSFSSALETLARRDSFGLRRLLLQSLGRMGLAAFVTNLMAPLTTAVGQGWAKGELRVADEHLFTEVAHAVLRQALVTLPEPKPDTAIRVLLTTVPGEPHGLGLLMVEALCALEGAWCVNLGPQTPLDDILAAAQWYRADVVGLSTTACVPVRWLRQCLQDLVRRLPGGTAIWLGGSAANASRGVRGVTRVSNLRDIGPALAAATAGRRATATDRLPWP